MSAFKLCFPAYFHSVVSGSLNYCSLLQPHRILQALRRYVRAENKDRLHTIRHYQHVLAVDPEKAAQMKSQVQLDSRNCGGSISSGETALISGRVVLIVETPFPYFLLLGYFYLKEFLEV